MWQLPNPSRFLDEVVESLAGSKHAVVLLPDPLLGQDPVALLSKRLSESGLGGLTDVSLGPSGHEDILDAIVEALGYDPADILGIEAFLDRDDLPTRFLAISGAEQGGERWLTRLSVLLHRAGEHAQVSEMPPFNLVVFASPRFVPPPVNLKLAHHVWWGVLSRLDIDCVTERSLVTYPPASLAEQYWLRALSAGVAQGDPPLAQLIIEAAPRDIDALCALLDCYAPAPPLDFPESLRFPESVLGAHRVKPPVNGHLRNLWSRGYLNWLDNAGLRVHPALLASLGRRGDITRLVWKGQMQVILPLVEQVRQTIVYWLEGEFGQDWVDSLLQGISDEDRSGVTGELGPLCHYLFRSQSPIRSKVSGAMSDMAHKWRWIRNEISHSRPVSLDAVADAFKLFAMVVKLEKLEMDLDGLL